MSISIVIESCIQAVEEQKTTEGFEVAMAPLVKECLLEDSFYKLPLNVIANVLNLAEDALSVPEASKIIENLYRNHGPIALSIIPHIMCGDIDSHDTLSILEPVKNLPVFAPLYAGKKAADYHNGKQERKDQELISLSNENQKLKEENQRLYGELSFLLQGTLAKEKQEEVDKLNKKIEALTKMVKVSKKFALEHIEDDLNIIDAVKLGKTDVVRALVISDPSNIEAIDAEYESTPLHWAAGWGRDEMVDILCDMGAEVSVRNRSGSTPFLCAAYDGQLECMKKLLNHGADINEFDNEGFAAIHMAADQGHLDVIKWLIVQGADLSMKTVDGGSLLWVAAGAGQLEILQFLMVDCGMSINECANRGNTVLHQAAFGCSIPIIKLCLKAGIDINVKTQDGLTPYDLAGNQETKEYLAHRGCDASL